MTIDVYLPTIPVVSIASVIHPPEALTRINDNKKITAKLLTKMDVFKILKVCLLSRNILSIPFLKTPFFQKQKNASSLQRGHP